MGLQTIEGIFDGKQVRLKEPITAPPNTRVLVTVLPQTKASRFPRTQLSDVAGCIPYTGPAKTVEEMDAAIESGVAETQIMIVARPY